MDVGTLFQRFERRLARLNRWLAPAALAGGTLQDGRPQQADASRVAAILAEVEKSRDENGPEPTQ